MSLRFFLALVFVFYAFATPVNAACILDDAANAGCCCTHIDMQTCTISGTCCPAEHKGDAVPPQAFRYSPHSAFVIAACIAQLRAEFGQKLNGAKIQQEPVHLASNKLYLKKRALLI